MVNGRILVTPIEGDENLDAQCKRYGWHFTVGKSYLVIDLKYSTFILPDDRGLFATLPIECFLFVRHEGPNE